MLSSRNKTRIVIKLTGALFAKNADNIVIVKDIVAQIKQLSSTYQFAMVIGGGSFFKGSTDGSRWQMRTDNAHQVGMLATIANSLIFADLLEQAGLDVCILSSLDVASFAQLCTPQALRTAFNNDKLVIFAGGLGVPYFSTDTAAVIRAAQIGASSVWKATNVAGVYLQDPHEDSQAVPVQKISAQYALEHALGVMDSTAYVIARDHKLPIRIFDAKVPHAFIKVAQDPEYASTILPE